MALHVVTVGAAPLAASLQEACERWADRPAVTFAGRTLSYRRLWAMVAALADCYRRIGIRPGDRVLCQLPNSPEHVAAVNAAWACGAVHVGVDNDLTARELSWLVGHTEAAALLYRPRPDTPDPLGPVQAVQAEHPETRVLLQGARPEHGKAWSLTEVLDVPDGGPLGSIEPRLGRDDTALLLLTSGTTGRPKAVPETLPNCWAKMQFFADAFGPGPDDVELLYLPMAHVFGLRLALLPLLRGGRLVLMDRFSPDETLRVVGEEGVTVLPGMPTHFTLLLAKLDPERHRVDRLRWGISAAANLPRPLVEQIYERLGVELLFVYGCSEGFTTLTTDRDEILRGSVGRTVFRGPEGTPPAGTVAVFDPHGSTPLPPGETGEIVFGASRPVQYWKDPPAATDGWYRTGDLGRIDPDGCVHVTGRLKELVNRGGLKVSPSEVEAAIVRHPGVADGAVVATADPILGEAVCACIVPAGEGVPDLAQLRAFLGRWLARHKLPDELCLVDEIPRTKIGKVDRAALAARVASPDGARDRQRLRPG